jgi:SAM-dependent methyltransferase
MSDTPQRANGPPDALSALTAKTLQDYDARAVSFREATWNHDVSQNIEALLCAIDGEPPFAILDFGCGPGRDLIDFSRRGHRPTGLDGSPALAAMARAASGCEVLVQDFLALDLPGDAFDGVFANASLQHVPAEVLPRVLRQLRTSLTANGVLFASIPHGSDTAGWNNHRYSVWHAPDTWRHHCLDAGFTEVASYFRPSGLPRERQPWFASVWRKGATDGDGAGP